MNESLTVRNFVAGIEDFEELISEKVIYIDKTSYLEDLIKRSHVALILRPRRFGKTLSMSTLSCFLEMNYQNPEDRSRPERLFKDLEVSKNKAFCDEYMGRYPVISLTFKDVEGANFREAVNRIIAVFARLARKFDFLTKKDNLDTSFLRRIRDLNDGKMPVFGSDGNFDGVNNNLILDFLANLSDCLNQAFNKAPFLIIDEYDVPLQKARKHGYYDKMLIVIRGILSSALKSNSSIKKAFVTGCLRIAHQSIFTGVNNFKTYGIQNEFLSGFIGLTKDDTIKLLEKCGLESCISDVSEWYDGYNFAGNDMLCPWSVLNFAGDALGSRNPAAFQPHNYWANSSGNDIIEICMKHPGGKDLDRLQNLMEGKTEEIALREFTSYPDITSNTDFDTFATLMLHTGYLTAVKDAVPSEKNRAVVRIPNKEILECFSNKVKTLFSESNPEWKGMSQELRESLFAGNAAKVSEIINKMLQAFISVRDFGSEGFYHGFITGVLGITAGSPKELKSNREGGNGYFDLAIMDERISAAVIMEFKISERIKASVRKKECIEALNQIERNDYDCEFRDDYDTIKKFGIVFFKKTCEVMEKYQLDKTSE
ncbi:AAA family ATPase [Succinimonas sp.]|uniref:AAA family ATPase n=1 Tax=Succinimonas sp. TaxID=1936151 RepID=UPI00386F9BEF